MNTNEPSAVEPQGDGFIRQRTSGRDLKNAALVTLDCVSFIGLFKVVLQPMKKLLFVVLATISISICNVSAQTNVWRTTFPIPTGFIFYAADDRPSSAFNFAGDGLGGTVWQNFQVFENSENQQLLRTLWLSRSGKSIYTNDFVSEDSISIKLIRFTPTELISAISVMHYQNETFYYTNILRRITKTVSGFTVKDSVLAPKEVPEPDSLKPVSGPYGFTGMQWTVPEVSTNYFPVTIFRYSNK